MDGSSRCRCLSRALCTPTKPFLVDHDPRIVRSENGRRSPLILSSFGPSSGQLLTDSAGQVRPPVCSGAGTPRPGRVESNEGHPLAVPPWTRRTRRTLARHPTATDRADLPHPRIPSRIGLRSSWTLRSALHHSTTGSLAIRPSCATLRLGFDMSHLRCDEPAQSPYMARTASQSLYPNACKSAHLVDPVLITLT